MIWLNGQLVARDRARIDPADRGFTLGDGLFETIAARGGKILRGPAHLARLRAGAGELRIPVPCDDATLAAALIETARANAIEDGVLRLTLTRGPAPRGLGPPADARPTLLIAAESGLPPETPARAVIARAARRDEASVLCRVKSLNYLNGVRARLEAADAGADEAILLNTQGRIADGAAASLFLFLGQWLVTPSLAEGALPGIVRAAAMRELGAVERPLTPADILAADEAVLVNSLGARTLIALDGRPVGSGVEGSWTGHLRALAHAEG